MMTDDYRPKTFMEMAYEMDAELKAEKKGGKK
jgi:hypothetical protein